MTASNNQPARFRSLLISFILFSSLFVGIVTLTPAVSADSGRTTGNEEITATVLSDYYERGSDISLVISANNLDSSTEYTLEYHLCYANVWYSAESNTPEAGCDMAVSNGGAGDGDMMVTGTMQVIPTSSTHTETITISDPGCCGDDWTQDPNGGEEFRTTLENFTFTFAVSLDVQDVHLTSNYSNPFVLGGEVDGSITYYHDNLLLNMESEGHVNWNFDYYPLGVLQYNTECGLFADGSATAEDIVSGTQQDHGDPYLSFYLTPANAGDYYVECTLTRDVDGTIMATETGEVFSVISDEGNQDDASITVEVSVDPVEDWGTVSMLAIDLDAGQGYTINWMVTDDSPNGGGILMIANDHIWVAGSSGTEEYVLEFHDLSDTTNACISVTLVAGETELQTVSGVCWDSHSTSDFDGDGVYDKDDMCENTPSGTVVQANGCSDTDSDGWTDSAEIECSTLVNDANSIPVDTDGDGICDYLDTDDDNDGYMDEIELLSGTNPLDPNDYPANQLPVCSIYYSLEVDGIPMEITGEAVIPTLPVGTGVTPEITVPAGSYYLIAVCVDPDNDPITVTVNDVTVGPMTGEVKAGAIVVIEAGVEESVEATITWTDGTNTATTNVIVNLDGDISGTGTGLLPGFTAMLGLVAMLGAALVIRTKPE